MSLIYNHIATIPNENINKKEIIELFFGRLEMALYRGYHWNVIESPNQWIEEYIVRVCVRVVKCLINNVAIVIIFAWMHVLPHGCLRPRLGC